MTTKVEHSARFETEDHEPLTNTPELQTFLSDVPDGTVLSPILWDKGDQRDPWRVMTGLVATWESVR